MNINKLSFKMFMKLKFKGIIYFQKVCSQGTFGKECNATCGNCFGECDRISGICLNGCAPGYIGLLCKKRKYLVNLRIHTFDTLK